jgi:hypothetical protein
MSEIELVDLFDGASWASIEQRHQAFAEEAEAGVVNWIAAHSDADWEGPYLLWAARSGMTPKTKALTEERIDWAKAVAYGMRGEGSIAVARRFSVVKGKRRTWTETLWTESTGRPAQLMFTHYDRMGLRTHVVLNRIAVPHPEHGRVERVQTWYDPRSGDGGEATETYTYDRDVLTAIDREYRGPHASRREHMAIGYMSDGRLARIEAHVTPPPPDHSGEFVLFVRSSSAAARRASRRRWQNASRPGRCESHLPKPSCELC